MNTGNSINIKGNIEEYTINSHIQLQNNQNVEYNNDVNKLSIITNIIFDKLTELQTLQYNTLSKNKGKTILYNESNILLPTNEESESSIINYNPDSLILNYDIIIPYACLFIIFITFTIALCITCYNFFKIIKYK